MTFCRLPPFSQLSITWTESISFDPEPYFADITGIASHELLAEWQWLLTGMNATVFRATVMGDLILRDDTNVFYFLDMVDGRIERLANTEESLFEMLRDRTERKRILSTSVVRGLRENGKPPLKQGQCYSPDHRLVLGGDFGDDNLQPCDFRVHASIHGQIHEQVKGLPPGTKISEIEFDIE